MEALREEFGRPITPHALARYLGVDVKTVRKYADKWGGVEVAPRRLLFFENLVREKIRENLVAPIEKKPEPPRATNERQRRRIGPPRPIEDPFGLLT